MTKVKIPSATMVIPWLVACALFIENLDVTILHTAIPTIAESFGQNPIYLKISLTSYLIGLSILIPISGWVADKYGARNVFIAGLLLFGSGSLLCGLSSNLFELAISRFIQGIGGAISVPVAKIILIRSFPRSQLPRMTTFSSTPSLMGPALGPVIGGIIVTYSSWRNIFFVNIPLVLIGVVFAYKYLENFKNSKIKQLDTVCFFIFAFGLSGFNFAIECIVKLGVANMQTIILITISIILLFIFFLKLYQGKQALFDTKLFKINSFRVTILGSFISRIGVGGIPFLLALMLQVDFQFSALESGLLSLPYAVGMIFTKLCINKLIKIFGYRGILFTNTILLGISIMSFASLSKETNLLVTGSLFFICGLLTSAQYSCLNILSYIDVPYKEVSSATSIGTTVQQIAMSFGVAFCAILLTVFSNNSGITYVYSFMVLGTYTILSSFIFLKLQKEKI